MRKAVAMRDIGRTTMQMLDAPRKAVYIWVNSDINYPIQLAKSLGRHDLQIVSHEWLDHKWRGLKISGIVVDHATWLSMDQWENYQAASKFIRWRHKGG